MQTIWTVALLCTVATVVAYFQPLQEVKDILKVSGDGIRGTLLLDDTNRLLYFAQNNFRQEITVIDLNTLNSTKVNFGAPVGALFLTNNRDNKQLYSFKKLSGADAGIYLQNLDSRTLKEKSSHIIAGIPATSDIGCVVADTEQLRIWFSTNEAIYVFSLSDKTVKQIAQTNTYGSRASSCAQHDRVAYFAGKNALYAYDMDEEVEEFSSIPYRHKSYDYLTSVQIDDKRNKLYIAAESTKGDKACDLMYVDLVSHELFTIALTNVTSKAEQSRGVMLDTRGDGQVYFFTDLNDIILPNKEFTSYKTINIGNKFMGSGIFDSSKSIAYVIAMDYGVVQLSSAHLPTNKYSVGAIVGMAIVGAFFAVVVVGFLIFGIFIYCSKPAPGTYQKMEIR
jgi:hypothetical protein